MSEQTPAREPRTEPSLDAEEEAAMEYLLRFMQVVQRWGLSANDGELTAAVHVLQGFVVQHMLHRLNPVAWSDWFRRNATEPVAGGSVDEPTLTKVLGRIAPGIGGDLLTGGVPHRVALASAILAELAEVADD